MPSPSSPTYEWNNRALGAVGRTGAFAAIFVLLLLLLGSAGAVSLPDGTISAAPPLGHSPIARDSARIVAPAAHFHAATGSNFTGTFFENNESVGNISSSDVYCGSYCDPQSQNPTLLNLSNGDLGLGFSTISDNSSAPCATTTNVATRIAWRTSADGGQTFSPIQYIGNSGSSGCPYYEGLEPSFAVAPSGKIYGTFVATNATPTTLLGSGNPRPILPYVARSDDALALITSADNGTTWSATQILLTGNISMPVIAVHGKSVYIAYINTSNTATSIPGSPLPGSAVHFIASINAGSTWSSPVLLPGHLAFADPTEFNNTMGASIAVSPSGTVAVAYAANRSCSQFCGLFSNSYGDDIVVATSTTNGSTWSGPHIVSKTAVEINPYYSSFTGQAVWENVVDTSLAYDTANGHLYIGWSQAVNLSLTDTYASGYDWQASGIFAGVSTDGGVTWTTSNVSPAPPPFWYTQQVFGQGYYDPAIAVSSGTVYLAYSHYNWTNGGFGYGAYTQNSYNDGNSEWLSSSHGGLSWAPPTLVFNRNQATGIGYFSYWGTWGSIQFDAAGNPIVAYSLQFGFFNYNPVTGTFTQPVTLTVATVYSGATTVLTVIQNGLSPGAFWEVEVSGNVLVTTATEMNITNAPLNQPFWLVWPGPLVTTGYETLLMPVMTEGPIATATGPTTVWMNFTSFYGIAFSASGYPPSFSVAANNFGQNNPYQFNFYLDTYFSGSTPIVNSGGAPFPWFFPAGSVMTFNPNYVGNNYYATGGFVGYWNGTGNGSFTGTASSLTLVINGPINETAWMAAYGVYNESFSAPTLSPTSTFGFTVDGHSYSAAGGATVDVGGLATGAYEVSGISATSSKAGWEYFGYVDEGNPIVIPDVPAVNLSFAFVDLGASSGKVAYHAVGLPNGSPWSLSFNGTEYSSSTPYINVTTRDGAYPVIAYPAVAGTGDQSFLPIGIGSAGNVVVGATYDVNFSSAYQLQVIGGAGGTVSPAPGTTFVAPGTVRNYTATASSGFSFIGWTGQGAGSYTGPSPTASLTVTGPITETATFAPLNGNRFNVTLAESGIPAGTQWSVYLDGQGFSSNATSLIVPNEFSCTFSGNAGRYSVTVPFVHANASGVRYVPTSYGSTVCGGGSTDVIQFAAQYSLTVSAAAGGSAVASIAGNTGASPYWVASGGTATIVATPDSGYTFLGWVGAGVGNYTGNAESTAVTLFDPVSEIAEFSPIVPPAPTVYTWTFTETPAVAAGTVWALTFNGVNYTSSTGTIAVAGLSAGSYGVTFPSVNSPDGLTRYNPVQTTLTVSVHSNGTTAVTFHVQYWLSVLAVGPGTILPGSEWVSSGANVVLNASPSGGSDFNGWVGTGPGAYSGSNQGPTITMTGPVSEVASFVPSAPAAKVVSTSSIWSSSTLWIALGVVGLVLGLVVGAVLARRRSPPASPPEASPPADEVAHDDSGGSA